MDSIIFDLDGTLWDSGESVTAAWNYVIKHFTDFNITVEEKFLTSLFGKPMNELLKGVFPNASEEELIRLTPILYDHINNGLLSRPGHLYEGVEETLKLLSTKVPLFIVSNCQCGYIEAFLEGCHMTPYFKDHLCFGVTNTSKDITMRKLIEKHGLKSPVYVGDTLGDYESCQKAEVPFVFAKYGFGDVPEATLSIDSMRDLPRRLNL